MSLYYRIIQKKDNKKNWKTVDKGRSVIEDVPFTYGRLKADRPKAKHDGDTYRVYSEKTNDGLNYKVKTVITYNKNRPNERVIYKRVDK